MARYLLVVLLCSSVVIAQFPALEQALIDLPAAEITLGNVSGSAIFSFDSGLSLFGRQACASGYSQCGNTGECCQYSNDPVCCGKYCLSRRATGTNCCDGFICPPQWKCCGPACYPEAGECCTAAGHSCPNADWKCCGNQGRCYPHQDFQCCSNDGEYCPKNTKCVYCRGSTTRVCCQGLDNDVQAPVFQTDEPSNGGAADIPQVQPSQAPTQAPNEPATTQRTVQQTTEKVTERLTETQRTTQTQTFQAQATRYISTTFTYTYTVWTRITMAQSVVQFTTTTTSTILSVLAFDSLDAKPTLFNMASSILASASRSAEAARPANTNAVTSTRQTTTQSASGSTSGAWAVQIDMLGCIASVLIAMLLL